MRFFFVTAFLLFGGNAFAAPGVYQKPSEFVKSSLGQIPATKAITLTTAQQTQVRAMLGKNYKSKSIRYWSANGKTAYILEEIGKTEDITTGIVVKGGRIDTVKVLIYRETHGSEVARDSFTRQLRGASLKSNSQLSKTPKNIAGATLSVRALTKLARLALYLETLK
ncbi:FMN-binding protein [Verrucomicrobiaceae bacterium 227]